MLAGIYYGAQYGGSTTAILVNLPGESSSVVTCLDGYQMARQGRAGPALAIAGLGSFFAGCVATLILATFAPPLAELAFKFGPAERFSLMVLGLVAAVTLAHGSLFKAIGMIVLGILLGLVGADPEVGRMRYTFGIPELTDGINFVVVAMGIFAFGEIIANLEKGSSREVFTSNIGRLWPSARGLPVGLEGGLARDRYRLAAGHPARRRRSARFVCRLHGGEAPGEGSLPLRQRRDRRRGRTGSRPTTPAHRPRSSRCLRSASRRTR